LVRLGKLRVTLDLRAQRPPVEIEIRHRHGALRIAHPHQRDIPRARRQRQLESLGGELRPPHVHLEHKAQVRAFQQAQSLDARAGAHAHFVLLVAVRDQEGRRAARAVAGDLRLAAIGIEQPDGGVVIGAEAGSISIQPSAPTPV
jgi:hypothetical protein